jgi:hypothetical protein
MKAAIIVGLAVLVLVVLGSRQIASAAIPDYKSQLVCPSWINKNLNLRQNKTLTDKALLLEIRLLID